MKKVNNYQTGHQAVDTKRVLVVGGVSYDTVIGVPFLPQPHAQTLFSHSYHEGVGSTGAGKAVALQRLGLETSLHAYIGADEIGRTVRDYFAQAGLTFIAAIDPKGTERHTNLIDTQGRRVSIYTHYATFEPDFDPSTLLPHIQQSDVLVLNIINYCRTLIPLAKDTRKPIWCDIHDWDGENSYHQDFVDAADYVFMSSDGMVDYRPFMEAMIAAGKRLVVCTHGKGGASAYDGTWYQLPALSYDYVDSNGAGDNFFAGYLYGHLRGYDIERCLQLGTIAGGLCVTSWEIAAPDLSPELIQREWEQHYT